MATPAFDRDTILRIVATWRRDEQLALAEAILHHALAAGQPNAREKPLVAPDTYPLTGILAREGEAPPDDATVARWLDEHRTEKYGG